MVYSKIKLFFEETCILIASIFVGILIGFFVGIICWFRFPLQIYREARVNLAVKRISEAKESLGQLQTEGIWEKHIRRIEEKRKHDN